MFSCSVTSVGEQASAGLACHVLDICNTRILLECPLDLNASLLFLPALTAERGADGLSALPDPDAQHVSKKQKVVDSSSWSSKEGGLPHPFKEVHGKVFVEQEPWYKLADLGTLDWSSIDAVLISNPKAMLGLPYLTQKPGFCGKVYVTDAVAKLGQLMMEEIIALHVDYTAQFGTSDSGKRPRWLELSVLPRLKDLVVGAKPWHKCNWHPLYSAGDLRTCIKMLHRLRYGEVASIDGYLEIKPVSSGQGVGTANWIITGADTRLAYISGALFCDNHSSIFNAAALSGSNFLLFGEVEPVDIDPSSSLLKIDGEICSESVDCVPSENKAGTALGGDSRAKPPPAKRSSSSRTSSLRNVSNARVLTQKSRSSESESPPVPPPKFSRQGSSNSYATAQQILTVEWKLNLTAICKAVLDATTSGGCVLFPVWPSGFFMELIEEISSSLSAGAVTVPMFYISPAAEEFLAYVNTIPEWLSSSRQENLYAGDALFRHVDLLQDKRLRHFSSLSSPELQRCWQEPCIVFASHWNMRMGPAVYLLEHWRQNPLNLLITLESNLAVELALAPFLPMAMKSLHFPVPSRLRPQEVACVIRLVQPNSVLLPGTVRENLDGLVATSCNSKILQYCETGRPIYLSNVQKHVTADMSSDIAAKMQLEELKLGRSSGTYIWGELSCKDGNWSLDYPRLTRPHKPRLRWGKLNLEKLLAGLKERGLVCIYMKDEVRLGGIGNVSAERAIVKTSVVDIVAPYEGRIEISSNETHVKVSHLATRLLVTEALNSALES